ncbi:MAG: phosphoribosylformylglycinamidine synthase [Clostridia bacterium]
MKNVIRIFVERRLGFDLEAERLKNQFLTLLEIKNIDSVRLFNRYDIQGLSDKVYRDAKYGIFAEIQTDTVYEEHLPEMPDTEVFAYEFLPGQYDQRADSCEQCIQLISQTRPIVRTAKVIAVSGSVTENDIDKIKAYMVNPVECRLACDEKPEDLTAVFDTPQTVETIKGFIGLDKKEIGKMRRSLGLAMSLLDLLFVRDYFIGQHRDPTITEIRLIDTYWSDHCRHTTFNTKLENVIIEDDKFNVTCKKAWDRYLNTRKELNSEKTICLMDIATIGAKYLKKNGYLDDMEITEENNACSIIVNIDTDKGPEEWLIMFKNETHNHPTEIEPFGGAATCIGGAIRDPLSGRAYVYQAMRVTGAGDPLAELKDTLPGKLPQIKIVREAANGYSSYGNQIGLATGQVDEIYHNGYTAKRMEIGAVIAAVPKKNIVRKDAEAGDVVILIGGRTGRDGLGGATGSSKEHTDESLSKCGAEVQKGNPPTERKIQRLFRNPKMSLLIKKCNDFGAGGIAVAIGELAGGLDIDLDSVPKKYEGLDGTELAISESQERMAVVVDRKDMDTVMSLSREENLEATFVAVVTDTDRLRMKWKGSYIVDIKRSFLDTNGVTQITNARIIAKDSENDPFTAKPVNTSTRNRLENTLSDLNVCSKKGLIEKFDSTIGSNTVLMPLGGKYQMTPQECMAAKIPVLGKKTDICTLMSYAFFPKISEWSPFIGACYAVLGSVAKIVCAGGDHNKIRLSLQEYFESLRSDESRWGKPLEALLGAFYAQTELCIPAIGGKDSMSGTFMDLDVPPTLVSFAVSYMDSKNVISSEFKKNNSYIMRFAQKRNADETPDFIYARKLFTVINRLICEHKIISAMTVKSAGACEALLKMCFGNMIGFQSSSETELLFTPGYCDILIEIDSDRVKNISELLSSLKELDVVVIGKTVEEKVFKTKEESISLYELLGSYTSAYERVFTTTAKTVDPAITNGLYISKEIKHSTVHTARPRVFIPVFPGTNCEYDMARAFLDQGAQCNIQVLRNLTSDDIEQSAKEFVKAIEEANIIALPGGFSAGDEPDGSGKFIATVFRNEYIKDAVHDLLYNRDGLIVGICNGFQALVKLGLVPNGKICDLSLNSPTLTYNSIGRHVSCMVMTKIISNISPWFSCSETGGVYTIPLSHGEGRFICSEEMYKTLSANGQIATQYVDENGDASYDIRFNPNGSYYAIEGITSADGRILGKMGHSERFGNNVAKNIPGIKDQKLFESGVRYFR